MIIDIHQHLNKKYYRTTEEYLDELVKISEEFNVVRFCISALGSAYENFENHDLEYVMKKLGNLIIGFAYIDLDRNKPEDIKVFYQKGFRGLKFICPLRNYDDDIYFPIYEQAAKYNMVLLFHTGILAPSSLDRIKHTSSDRMRPIRIESIARTFPSTTVVGAHFGSPWFEEASAVMRVNPNIYFDISGGALANSPQIFDKLVQPVRFEKFVFGTDSLPRDFIFPYERTKRFFEDMHLDDEIRDRIMFKNAAGFLELDLKNYTRLF